MTTGQRQKEPWITTEETPGYARLGRVNKWFSSINSYIMMVVMMMMEEEEGEERK